MQIQERTTEFKYLIESRKDQNYGLTVSTVGFQSIKPGTLYPPRSHPESYFFSPQKGRILHEYQLLYITKGCGIFESDSTPKTEISKGTMIMLFPGQWHNYYPLEDKGWNEYYIGFEGSIADMLLRKSYIKKDNQIITVGINERIVSLFVEALEVAEAEKSCYQQYISGIALHIVGELIYISNNQRYEFDNAAEKIESAKVIMRENIDKNIDVKELAERLNIGYSWFRKVFKEYTGYAPAKYFQELKISRSKQLLVETSLPIKEICYKLNYSSIEHFFSIFKKSTSMTPTEYRNFSKRE